MNGGDRANMRIIKNLNFCKRFHFLGAVVGFLFFLSSLTAKTVDDFSTFNSSSFVPTSNLTVSLSSTIFHNASGALLLTRNIAYDSANLWSATDEVIEKLSASVDLSSYAYFSLWYYDAEMLSGKNATVIQIGLYDGDEWWYSTQKITALGWGQIVIPLKNTGATNDEFIDGFTVPNWEKRDSTYVGNGIFNSEKISQIKFSLGAPHLISGNFYIDDINAVNLVSKSIPKNNAYISYKTSIKIYFGESMNKFSVTEQSNIKVYDKVNNIELTKTLSYDENNKLLTINNVALEENKNYEIILTNAAFDSLRIADAYHLNFSTQYPKTVYPDYSYVIQDYTDGSYIYLPENSVVDTSVVNIETKDTASITEFSALKYKSLTPAGESLKQPATLVLFTDEFSSYNNLFLYIKEGGKWKKAPSIWYKDEGYIEAAIHKFSEIALSSSDYTGAEEKIIDVNLSSNPFTPNNDGKNDKVYFNLILASGGTMSIKIYNNTGDLIKTVADNYAAKTGRYDKEFYWDGKDDMGNNVPPGIYLYTVEVSGDTSSSSEYYVWYENSPNITKIKGVIGIAK